MKKYYLACLALFAGNLLLAQEAENEKPVIKWMVFADLYYSFDFNQPADHKKASFIYNHNRHNEVNLNLGLIQASYKANKVRGSIGLQGGTYPEYNYATEPGMLRNIYQANVGVKLSPTRNLWLDVGILPSHLGYESPISSNNWTLTRSLMAENSPYYLAGAKLGYTTNDSRWFVGGMLLNGWQHITRTKGNQTPAFGSQLTFTPNKSTTFNWSTFIGNDYPDSARKWRYYNNFYTIVQAFEKVGFIIGLDVAFEQQSKGSGSVNTWYTPNIVVRYTPSDGWAIAGRAEYFSDKNEVIVGTGTPNGFKTLSGSINVDRKVGNYFWWRSELRTFSSQDAIFNRRNKAVSGDTFFTTSFAVLF